MVGFELGKQVEKDVFRLVSSVGRKKKILSPHEESNLRLQDSALRRSTTEPQRLYGERGLLWSSYDTRPAYCWDEQRRWRHVCRSNCRSIIEQLLFRLHVLFCRSNNYQVNDTVDLRGLLLLSLPIKTSPVYITLEAITEIHFERPNSLTRSFRLISWESSDQITRQ